MNRGIYVSSKTKEHKLVYFTDVKSAPVSWLAKPYIALGKISVMQGDPGCGKTTVMLSIAAAVSTGHYAAFF
jgi:MoxR-like ATPase